MPWQNPKVHNNTELDDVFAVSVEFVDAVEFATNPFVYTEERVRNNPAGRSGFKTRATAALAAERSKRQNVSTKETQFLTFMNT